MLIQCRPLRGQLHRQFSVDHTVGVANRRSQRTTPLAYGEARTIGEQRRFNHIGNGKFRPIGQRDRRGLNNGVKRQRYRGANGRVLKVLARIAKRVVKQIQVRNRPYSIQISVRGLENFVAIHDPGGRNHFTKRLGESILKGLYDRVLTRGADKNFLHIAEGQGRIRFQNQSDHSPHGSRCRGSAIEVRGDRRIGELIDKHIEPLSPAVGRIHLIIGVG